MATEKNQTFLLVSIFGKQTKIEKEGPIGMIQFWKKKWAAEPQWKKYTFQVRTKGGYDHIKILPPKNKDKKLV